MGDERALRATERETHRAAILRDAGEAVPTRPDGAAPADGELVRYAARRVQDSEDPTLIIEGLGLLAAARTEIDEAEAQLLFAARAAGMTFQQIASALGLGSGQAAQQRMARVLARLDGEA